MVLAFRSKTVSYFYCFESMVRGCEGLQGLVGKSAYILSSGLKGFVKPDVALQNDVRSCIGYFGHRPHRRNFLHRFAKPYIWLRKFDQPGGQVLDCCTTGWSLSRAQWLLRGFIVRFKNYMYSRLEIEIKKIHWRFR